MLVVHDLVGGTGDAFAQRPDPFRAKLRVDHPLHSADAEPLDEQFAGTVDGNFGNVLVRKERLQALQRFVEKRELLHL